MTAAGGGNIRPRALSRGRQLGLVGVAAVIVAILVAGLLVLRRPPPQPPAAPTSPTLFQPTAEERREIGTAVVGTRTFVDAVASEGRVAVDDERTTQIFPPFTGRVTRVFVSAGESVRRGQPLAAFVANELVQAQSDLTTSAAATAQARVQRDQARASLDRLTALRGADAAAERDVEQARTDLASAEQLLANARAAEVAAEGRLQVLNVAGQASAFRRRAGPAGAAVLAAPISGVVTSRQVGPGQFVDSVAGGASQPIMTVSDLSRVWIVANLRDADAARVRAGAPLTAEVAGLAQPVRGRVNYVAPALDPTLHRVVVRAEVANPEGRLRPDLFAQVRIEVGAPTLSPAVPRRAVVYDGPNARVWLQTARGFELRPVRVGREEQDAVEILGGLRPGDRVAVSGGLFIDQAAQGD